MEKFSLDKWLKDKSRKVVTRTGKPVRIVCWDAPTKNPIYGFVEGDDGITSWRKDGRFSNLIDNVDLFFEDEKDGLTEFEEQLASILFDREYEGKTNTEDDIERSMLPYRLAAKEYSQELIDLARKELEEKYRLIDKMGRFISITEFDNCSNCPFCKYVNDDYSPRHTECTKLNEYIQKWGFETKTVDYRNENGVLDDCPFLINNVIKEED